MEVKPKDDKHHDGNDAGREYVCTEHAGDDESDVNFAVVDMMSASSHLGLSSRARAAPLPS